jgi:phage gp36-like protein
MDRYLHPGDYSFQIRKEIKDLLGGADEKKLNVAENAAVEEMRSYLKKRYDIDNIFFLISAFDVSKPWPKDSLIYYKANNTDGDETTQVFKASADVPANDPAPLASGTKWVLFTGRNPFVIMKLVDITLYHLHSKDSSRLISKVREDRYQDAQDWLKLVAKGEIDANLPQKAQDDPTVSSEIRFNSHPVENFRW